MDEAAIARAAAYLAEAFGTANALAPLPPGLHPQDRADAEAIAGAMLERLGMVPCGLRLAPGPGGGTIAGPVLEARLLADGSRLPLSMLRHVSVSAAAIGVLAEPLLPDEAAPPVLSGVHPAIDVACSRFRDRALDPNGCVADLGGLGYVIAGARAAPPGAPIRVVFSADPARRRGAPVALDQAFNAAALEARRLGGLPAGGVLVVAGLSPAAQPRAGETWTARFSGLGRAKAGFVGAEAG